MEHMNDNRSYSSLSSSLLQNFGKNRKIKMLDNTEDPEKRKDMLFKV
jgi:hypothetical protein